MACHAPSGEASEPEGRRELPAESEEIPDAASPHREINCLPSAAASRTWQVAS